MTLNLKLHRYAVLRNGERIAFLSTLESAATLAYLRHGQVANLDTGQNWSSTECAHIAQGAVRAA